MTIALDTTSTLGCPPWCDLDGKHVWDTDPAYFEEPYREHRRLVAPGIHLTQPELASARGLGTLSLDASERGWYAEVTAFSAEEFALHLTHAVANMRLIERLAGDR